MSGHCASLAEKAEGGRWGARGVGGEKPGAKSHTATAIQSELVEGSYITGTGRRSTPNCWLNWR